LDLPLFPVVVCTGLMSAAFFSALRRRWPSWAFLLLGLLPTLFVYAANPLHRVYSFHGFFHVSVVYRILCGAVPPDNPIFSGEPLLYPWIYHALAAALSRSLRVSPPWAFALTNLCALAVTLRLVYLTAERTFRERDVAVDGVLLSIFGLGFTSAVHLNGWLLRRYGIFLEFRGIPPATYFAEIQADGCGLAFYSLFLFSLMRFLAEPARPRRGPTLVAFAFGLLGAALLYPFYFTAAFATAFAAVAWLAAERRIARGDAVRVLAASIVVALIAAPYLLSLIALKAAQAQIHLAPSSGYVLRKLAMFLALIGPLCLVLGSERRSLVALSRDRPIEARVLAAAIFAPTLLYLLTAAPLSDEFKFQTLALIGLGIASAGCVHSLHRRHPRLAMMVVTAFLFPMASQVALTGLARWEVTDPFVERGTDILAARPDDEALYSWVRNDSPRDAVFVDTWRTIPVFGQRALFVALDGRPIGDRMDGWKISADDFLKRIDGYRESDVERRVRLARSFYEEDDGAIDRDVLAEIGREIGERPLYVVARAANTRDRLERDSRFRRVFFGSAGAIYQWLRV
jgi:hypothetical protein